MTHPNDMSARNITDQVLPDLIQRHGVFAYPTESVYGLGCVAADEKAVLTLLQWKRRPVSKGLIVIAAQWDQVSHWIDPSASIDWDPIHASWPGPTTWLFPINDQTPPWLHGVHSTLAIRITAYDVASRLCKDWGPLVSTSANIAGQPALRDVQALRKAFPMLQHVVSGALGGSATTSRIIDACTQKIMRG